jgi:hypothetical protein
MVKEQTALNKDQEQRSEYAFLGTQLQGLFVLFDNIKDTFLRKNSTQGQASEIPTTRLNEDYTERDVDQWKNEQIHTVGEHLHTEIQKFLTRFIIAYRTESKIRKSDLRYLHGIEYLNFKSSRLEAIQALLNLLVVEIVEAENLLTEPQLWKLQSRIEVMLKIIENHNSSNELSFSVPGKIGKKFTFTIVKENKTQVDGTHTGFSHTLKIGIPNRAKKLV